MKIGVWLHDTVDGNRLKVHYFAQKPERDTDRILNRSKPEIKLIAEYVKVIVICIKFADKFLCK